MARPLRIEFSGAIYHITSRGNAGQGIFLRDGDRKLFLKILTDTVDRYNWICHSYCLMNNHYHLLIETNDPNLSLGMRHLNGVYTQAFNRLHTRSGHLFQGRYKSILVEKGSHLLELCRYIVLNPVKAGFVKHPNQWKWSSFKATAGKKKSASFLTTDWILGQFSRKKQDARQRYIRFVKEGLHAHDPRQGIEAQLFLGSEEFIAKMGKFLDAQKDIGEIPRKQRYVGRPSLVELFQAQGSKKERNRNMAKAHLDYGYTLKQIAEATGVHYTTVSRAVSKARKM